MKATRKRNPVHLQKDRKQRGDDWDSIGKSAFVAAQIELREYERWLQACQRTLSRLRRAIHPHKIYAMQSFAARVGKSTAMEIGGELRTLRSELATKECDYGVPPQWAKNTFHRWRLIEAGLFAQDVAALIEASRRGEDVRERASELLAVFGIPAELPLGFILDSMRKKERVTKSAMAAPSPIAEHDAEEKTVGEFLADAIILAKGEYKVGPLEQALDIAGRVFGKSGRTIRRHLPKEPAAEAIWRAVLVPRP